MKLSSPLLVLSAISAVAQTPAKAPVKPGHHTAAVAGCAKLPELSAKIPALPAGLPCAKHLYTINIHPPVTLENVSPYVSATELAETLHIQEASTFSLDYIDIKQGTGAPVAPHKWLTVEYSGYLIDGTKFDSSDEHPGTPFSFEYGQLGGQHSAVPGWETGFDGMKVGAKRRLFIPFELAYGAQARPKIPAKSMLIFDMELKAVSDKDPNPAPAPPMPRPMPPKPAGAPTAPATPPTVVVKPAPAPATTPTPASATTPKPQP